MYKIDNSITTDPNYVCSSKINSQTRKMLHVPNTVTLSEIKNAFDECQGQVYLVGSPGYASTQRHTKYVSLYELYNKLIKH